MEKMSRRRVLKTMARVSAVAAAAACFPGITGCRRDCERETTLNVVLHGLFVLNFTDVNLELYTPFVEDHIYRAGNWNWGNLQDLKPNRIYRLCGVESPAIAPQVDSKCNILPSPGCYQLRPEYSVFRVDLPFPRTISLIRCVPPEDVESEVYTCGYTSSEPQHVYPIKELSLCQVLTYPVPRLGGLALSNTSWEPDRDPETGVVNLHFWAEPPLRLDANHACTAYAKLSEMLAPLEFQLQVRTTAPLDLDTGVYGLPPQQEQGMSEWMSGGEGSYPTNCSTAMLGATATPRG
jgi:hypothetical protein